VGRDRSGTTSPGAIPTGNLLIVYALRQWPLRRSVRDHVYAFERHGRARAHPMNLLARSVPTWVTRGGVDAVVFHTTFLSALRWGDQSMRDLLFKRSEPLAELGVPRVALPQDEFLRADTLREAVDRLAIDHVMSVAGPSEWQKIYGERDPDRVRFTRVLTGYLDDGTVRAIDALTDKGAGRPIDVGYRAWHAAPWLGRHGRLKTEIAEAFATAGHQRGLVVDISTRDEDTLFGDDWLRFLTRCKYTIGVEGGASVLDRDGSIVERTNGYVASHPDAPFEEIEAACFPGEDGYLDLRAISPRHLEACAARTCQVLVEGEYNDVLAPGKHYIALKRDLSNLDVVLDMIARDDQRPALTEAAYDDVVASRTYSYQRFVAEVERAAGVEGPRGFALQPTARYAASRAVDRAAWMRTALDCRVVGPVRTRAITLASRVLPTSVRRLLRRHRAASSGHPAP
jgi:hypothetical protein